MSNSKLLPRFLAYRPRWLGVLLIFYLEILLQDVLNKARDRSSVGSGGSIELIFYALINSDEQRNSLIFHVNLVSVFALTKNITSGTCKVISQ